jgi:hypothetical protein
MDLEAKKYSQFLQTYRLSLLKGLIMSQAGTRRRLLPGKSLLWIAVLAVGVSAFYTIRNEGRNTMPTVQTSAGLVAGVPPIDRAAPLKTETATFGLG